MKHVVEQAQKLAMLSAPLLITGDTGTGKIFAYACTIAGKPQAGKQHGAELRVYTGRCGRGELFGHARKKKRILWRANGGSVLLDEIIEMSPRMQAEITAFP